ncbi:hypothetical protein ABZ816_29135 [Actinosynnema sp. NPDC047251]|uniref:Uncharacterized protein n=1 Tax=Saccharothrix espanaensis (strain ATCC 51144 / DSM 44229 / JCM 9112 / NBRC 15066 / NRRL 15764) TaxID=1179773 RepID=K0JSF8_SACES|nr:hypothetical protein [Saccharothrix espanaensis]CCH28452.1 hypothetical protein BN6_11260 [Saccharothrix espanaensis DSM 44229]
MNLTTLMDVPSDAAISYELYADRALELSIGRTGDSSSVGLVEGVSLALGEEAVQRLIDKLTEGLNEIRSAVSL